MKWEKQTIRFDNNSQKNITEHFFHIFFFIGDESIFFSLHRRFGNMK